MNPNNKINFEKRLVANCQVLNKGKRELCRIFELDKKVDTDYFKPLLKDRDWKGEGFVRYFNDVFTHAGNFPSKFYALETSKGKKLGFCEMYKTSQDFDQLEMLVAAPKDAHTNSNRKRKYIGETIMAFLVKKTKLDGKKAFFIPFPISDACDFYVEKCGFEKLEEGALRMLAPSFDKLIEQNQIHTKGTLDIVG